MLKYPTFKNVLLALITALLFSCTSPGGNNKQIPENTVQKSANEQLLTFVDSVAHQFAIYKLDEIHLKHLTDSFKVYIPIAPESTNSPSDSTQDTIIVSIYKQEDSKRPSEVLISIPYALGKQLSFKQITNYFGPLEPIDSLSRMAKAPFPISLKLDKHFNEQHPKVYLSIHSAFYPEEPNNQIAAIDVIRTK